MSKKKKEFYGFEISTDLKQRMEHIKKAGYPITPELYRAFTEEEVLKREKILSSNTNNT